MKHFSALVMKYIIVSVAMLMILGVFNYTIGVILLLSLGVTLISYVVGDLFLLPKFGFLPATIADFAMAFVFIWLFNTFFITHQTHNLSVSFFTALLITTGEVYFHAYLNEKFYGKGKTTTYETGNPRANFATEFAEENDVINRKEIKEDNKKN